jgi:hypothetical protein
MDAVMIGSAALAAAVCAAAVTVSAGGGPDPAPHPGAPLGVAAAPTSAARTPSAGPPDAARRAPDAARAPAVAGEAATAPVQLVAGRGRQLAVVDDESLERALQDAAPGDVIELASGTYRPVEITRSGSAAAPITLAGPADAVFAGGGSGYVIHLDGASYWQLTGFTATGGAKGVVVDGGSHNVLDRLTVGRTGEEAIHFRSASSDNVVQHSRVHDSGLEEPGFGEGVYIGSAKSNWGRYGAGGGPDLSMRNRVLDTTFANTAAENVDIKEGTAGAVLARNLFDGSGLLGENSADSVVDVKGYGAIVVDNVTRGRSAALHNVIETHVITDPATSGCGNTFRNNTVEGFEPTGELVAVDEKCGDLGVDAPR